jgi:DNA-directed RNA polymerase subunit alpha
MPEKIDVRRFIREDAAFTKGDLATLEGALAGTQIAEVRHEITALQAELGDGSGADEPQLLRAGIGSYLLGQHERAIRYLSKVTSNAAGAFFEALALSALDRHPDAEKKFVEAGKKGYDPVECALRQAGELRQQGKVDEAEAALRSVATQAAGRAEYSYQMGCIWSDRGDVGFAVEYFERAVDMDPHHSRALFRLAGEYSSRANDEEAIRLYEQSLSRPPYYLGALLNLGLLYEDTENYKAAAYCFRRILEVDPNHERARLYLRDIEATSDMYYDEDSLRNEARLAQLLSRPVTDFELSVRSRNCLQQMNIYTLGDLTRVSEHELLSGKNFGETSLEEIRDMMQAHGLAIGMNLHQGKPADHGFFTETMSPEEEAALNQSLADLNLSVRARKCMMRLGLTSVGELVRRTADELLASRNFGVTSLNEIRAKLTELGLKLRND